MTHRSDRFRKIKQALTQAPANTPLPKRPLDAPRPWRETPPKPHPIPAAPKPLVDFRDPSRLPHVAPLVNGDGFAVALPATQVLPVVDVAATQQLPAVPSDPPPSAQHADARAGWSRMHVEDNDLEPQTRGRHVLAELTAGPDIATELMAVQSHIHNVYDPWIRAEVAQRANDDRMRAFAAKCDAWETRYEREFESWAQQFRKALAATRARWAETSGRTNAERLAKAYESGGTSAALFTKDELAAEIVRRDAEKAQVAA